MLHACRYLTAIRRCPGVRRGAKARTAFMSGEFALERQYCTDIGFSL